MIKFLFVPLIMSITSGIVLIGVSFMILDSISTLLNFGNEDN